MSRWKNTSRSYGLLSRSLHWMTVAIVLIQFAYGISFVVEDIRSVAVFDSLVESLGMLLIPITLFRIVWTLTAGVPALPKSVKPFQALLARTVQSGLYLLILICAVSGFSIRNQSQFFYAIEIPDYFDLSQVGYVHLVHDVAVYVLAGLILLHVSAAVLHACLRDGVVKTMFGRH